MTPKGAKSKGDRAEREVRTLIQDHLGIDAPRLRAGETHDRGDLRIPETCLEVKSYEDTWRGIREGLDDLETEQANSGMPYAAVFARRRGGNYVVAMTPQQFFALWRAATT